MQQQLDHERTAKEALQVCWGALFPPVFLLGGQGVGCGGRRDAAAVRLMNCSVLFCASFCSPPQCSLWHVVSVTHVAIK